MSVGFSEDLSIGERLDRIERMLGIQKGPSMPFVPLSAVKIQCGKCKMTHEGATGYVCAQPDCPIMPRVTA